VKKAEEPKTPLPASTIGFIASMLEAAHDVDRLEVTVGALCLKITPNSSTSPVIPMLTHIQQPRMVILSPTVGYATLAVKVGDLIKVSSNLGQIHISRRSTATVGVESIYSGTVVDLLVKPGEPVEYSQPLLSIKLSTKPGLTQ